MPLSSGIFLWKIGAVLPIFAETKMIRKDSRTMMAVSPGLRRFLSYATILAAALAAALWLGKDFAWDSLAYHFYAGFNGVGSRLDSDYFAASAQSYLNPYSHVPFFLMVTHGLAPQLVVALLALFHGLNLLIVYETALVLNRRADGFTASLPVGLAVTLAFLNPVFLVELGTSFNEISTSVPVLAGWYLLIRDFYRPSARHVALAGFLIGVALALKLSNLLFSVTALPLLLFAPVSWRTRAKMVAVFACGGAIGALLAGGWWAWQLWQAFGNPVFPMFNNIFQSPEFVTGAIKHYRFLSSDAAGILLKPFQMILPKSGVHVEVAAPDLRYAALLVLFCLFGIKLLLGRLALAKHRAAFAFPAFQGQRALAAVTASFLLAWFFWVTTTGNSRYFLPMACLAAVVLSSLLARFSLGMRIFCYGGAVLVIVQATLVGLSVQRYNPAQYGKSWFELQVPPALRHEPALYLHVGFMPASFLLPFLPEGSSMINLGGQYPLAENARIRALLERHRGHVRVMRRSPNPDAPINSELSYALIPFGLQADLGTCENIVFERHSGIPKSDQYYYASCKTRPLQWTTAQWQDYAVNKQRADAVFDQLELLCPAYFQPRGLPSEGNGKQFWRVYMNTDTMLRLSGSGMVSFSNDLNYRRGEIGYIDQLVKALPDAGKICPP
jgi:hypothetical protein